MSLLGDAWGLGTKIVTDLTKPVGNFLTPPPPPTLPSTPQVTQPKFWTPTEYQAQFIQSPPPPPALPSTPQVTQPKFWTPTEYQAQFVQSPLVNQNQNPLISGLTNQFNQFNNPVSKPSMNLFDQTTTNLQNAFKSGTVALGGLAKQETEFMNDNPLMIVPPVGIVSAMVTPDKTDPTKMKWDVWNENVAKATTQKFIPDDATLKTMTAGPTADFTRGFIGQFRDKPLDVGLDLGTAIGLELISGGTATPVAAEIAAGGGVRTLAKTVAVKAAPYVGPAMMSLYGGSALKNVLDQPTPELQQKQLGGETARFLTAFGPNAIKSGVFTDIVHSGTNDINTLFKDIERPVKNVNLDLSSYNTKYGVPVTPALEKAATNAKSEPLIANYFRQWGSGEDLVGAPLSREKGFTGLPQVIPKDQFESLDGIPIFRGVKSGKTVNTYNLADDLIGRDGMMGSGTYFADKVDTAKQYGDKIIVAKLKPDAKIITSHDLFEKSKESGMWDNLDNGEEINPISNVLRNEGRYATALGYDAIHAPELGYYNVLNRGATIVPVQKPYNALDIFIKEPIEKALPKLKTTDKTPIIVGGGVATMLGITAFPDQVQKTTYNGIDSFKKAVSNLGFFGEKHNSKHHKPKPTPKKKQTPTKLQQQPNKDIIKNCWEISTEPLDSVKKSKRNKLRIKPVQIPIKNAPIYISNKQFDKKMDDILYGSQKVVKNQLKTDTHVYKYREPSSSNKKQLDKIMDDVVYGSQEMSSRITKHKLEKKHQTDHNTAAYTPLSKLAHW